MSSQANRDPMLLFEFDAALFQFEHREPEFAALFQLPPRSTALLPNLPFALPALYPRANHLSNFCNQNLCCLQLVERKAFDRKQEAQPKPQMCKGSIYGIYFRDLIAFPGLV
jgi:hypothetical protein